MRTTRTLFARIVATAFLLASFSAAADSRIAQVWTCTLNEGHTVENLNEVHGRWIAWANRQPYGGDIQGSVAQSMVASAFVVLIVDSYPDLETMAADWQAYTTSKEGRALEAAYDEVSTCESNALYAVTTSGSD